MFKLSAGCLLPIIGTLTLSQISIGMNGAENASCIRKYVYISKNVVLPAIAKISDECSDPHEIMKANLDQIQSYFLTNILVPTKTIKLRTYVINAEILSPIVLNINRKGQEFPILNYNQKNVLQSFFERISGLNANEREIFCTGHSDSDVDDLIDLLGNYSRPGSIFTSSVFAIVLNTIMATLKEQSSHPFFHWLFQKYIPHFQGIQMVTLAAEKRNQ